MLQEYYKVGCGTFLSTHKSNVTKVLQDFKEEQRNDTVNVLNCSYHFAPDGFSEVHAFIFLIPTFLGCLFFSSPLPPPPLLLFPCHSHLSLQIENKSSLDLLDAQ